MKNYLSFCGGVMCETVTLEHLKRVLHYDPLTGAFVWRIGKKGLAKGALAKYRNPNGYIYITIDKRSYGAHRLAWLYMTGEWPIEQIDHLNSIRHDNRWVNLRQATSSVNSQNIRSAFKNNKCGFLGVIKLSRLQSKPWVARIRVNGKDKHLGYFETPNGAHEAYIQAKRIFHEGCTL